MFRPSASLTLLCLAPLALGASEIPSWPAPPPAVDALVAEAFHSNLALAGESLEVERAAARLAEARSQFLPRVDLLARYSAADGGRTIDFPVGDLLNGAYATLNQFLATQGQPARFPSVANQSIPLLRSREQETKLRLTQPLYAPEITRGNAAARAGLAAREAQLTAYRRHLRAAVIEAFFRHEQATAAVATYRSALELVTESLRVNRVLVANDKATDDAVLRATAELATVQQQLADAEKDCALARSYANFLLNRPLATRIAPLDEAEAEHYAAELARAAVPALDAQSREEIAALSSARTAARATTEAAQSRQRPSLGLAVETGIQGESYRTGAGSNYTIGSVVLEWNLFDGSERRHRVAQARIDERQADRALQETRQQLDLQLQQARDEFSTARLALASAVARRDAARATYRLVARREAEGIANQLTVLDARHTLTSAELNFSITRARLAIAAAQLDRASALTPLP